MSSYKSASFTLGNRSEHSSIWHIALNPRHGDIYISSSDSSKDIKVSLHASGVWRMAMTEESGIVIPETGDRLLHRWSRPKPATETLTVAFTICVMNTAVQPRRTTMTDARAAKIVWLPVNHNAPATEVNILLTDKSEIISASDWPGKHSINPTGLISRMHGKYEIAWVVYRDSEITDGVQQAIDEASGFTMQASSPEDTSASMWFFGGGKPENNYHIVELGFPRANIHKTIHSNPSKN